MKGFIIKLRHLTWRRILNKVIQIIKQVPHEFSLRKIERKNEELFEMLSSLTDGIKDSNGSSYYNKAHLKVGIITDEFMYNYYKDAVELYILSHDSYEKTIDEENLDIVMYVSCWRGMQDNDWYGDVLHEKIPEVLKYAKSKKIPTIFQSIEDPTNYDRYLPIAKESNYIFTTDVDCIEQYEIDTKNEAVFLLEYGVNPLFHNPIGINEKYDRADQYDCSSVFFAGSWMDRYENRCNDIRLMFDGVMHSRKNLVIADRNVDVKLPGYRFPKKYRPFVVPAIDHSMLQKVHKLFEFNININTVQDSSTMCAMRVYELQALGCIMLTNYSLAVSNCFPGLFMIQNHEEVEKIVNGYSRDELYKMQVENLRNVMTDCTVFDRLNYIFEKSKIDYRFPILKVIVLCNRKTEKIIEMFKNQRYPQKELFTHEEYSRECPDCDYIAHFAEDYVYGNNYITDMINAFKYCDVQFVTKDCDVKGREYDFVNEAGDICKTLFTVDKYKNLIESNLNSLKLTGKGFKLDRFELNDVKQTSDPQKEIAVIVPVYNNGKYLQGRCFRSLLRSSVFDKMRIYIIDDGSDDKETLNIIRNIANQYDNVSVYFFGKGGSGSAARPRNKGLEISKEPYVTYLDPDNEAIGDGYAQLYEILKNKETVDMAFGAIYMRTTSEKLVRLGYLFKDMLISEPKKLLISENFRSQSIQACLINRALIEDNRIVNPESAFGEDTLFFYELMLNSNKIYYLNIPIHTYYAQRSDSSINVIGKGFFTKSFVLEQYQIKRLKGYDVLGEYKTRKLDYFMINWYMDKLNYTDEIEKEECINILENIASLYGKSINDYKKYIER
ncbi:MAG: glycosyltransferase [Clostridiales bacterium]|nr:glycosyltransferase [Clostridiales bacterium]